MHRDWNLTIGEALVTIVAKVERKGDKDYTRITDEKEKEILKSLGELSDSLSKVFERISKLVSLPILCYKGGYF